MKQPLAFLISVVLPIRDKPITVSSLNGKGYSYLAPKAQKF
jgi:hypothetical protein